LTVVLLWAGVVPSAGQSFKGGSHWLAHFASFAMLAFALRCGLPRASTLAVALAVIAFGAVHEAIEIIGHVHAYELGDVIVDAIGAGIGAVAAHFPARRLDRG
jgi:VanZ family protein